jgi:hypothetical protein
LRDALDHAALAGGITPFKKNDDPLSARNHPVLQLDEFRLQAEELREVLVPLVPALRAGGPLARRQRVTVLDLHFQLFVVAVSQVATDAADDFFMIERGQFSHAYAPRDNQERNRPL